MPYKIRWEAKGVYIKLFDQVDSACTYTVYSKINNSPRFDDIHYIIFDMLEMNSPDYTVSDTERFAYMDRAGAISNPNIRMAIVCVDEGALAMSSFYQSETKDSPWQVELFQSLEDAREWLKKPPHSA